MRVGEKGSEREGRSESAERGGGVRVRSEREWEER